MNRLNRIRYANKKWFIEPNDDRCFHLIASGKATMIPLITASDLAPPDAGSGGPSRSLIWPKLEY